MVTEGEALPDDTPRGGQCAACATAPSTLLHGNEECRAVAHTALLRPPPRPLQLGGSDRIPPGGSTFLDKDAVLRRQEGKP